MQDIRLMVDLPLAQNTSANARRQPIAPGHSKDFELQKQDNFVRQVSSNFRDQPHSPSSEEDNSATEMNSCRRLIDKPPLVKRLTMGMGFIRNTEESYPLMMTKPSSLHSSSAQTIFDGYVNEAICESEKYISNKLGDVCSEKLSSLPNLEDNRSVDELNELACYKSQYMRQLCNAKTRANIFATSTPLSVDILTLSEQSDLKGAPWFQAGIPREISLEVLARQSPGAFLVRQSSTKPGCFALSLRVPAPTPKVAHYLILRTTRGYKIQGFTKEFSTLRALITHHSVMPELLPVPLNLPRTSIATHNTQMQAEKTDQSTEFDSTYGSLNEFRKLMSEMNI